MDGHDSIIGDVLNEVNDFIDAMDGEGGSAYNFSTHCRRDNVCASGVENDTAMMSGNAGDDSCVNDDGSANALNESKELISSLSSRYLMAATVGADKDAEKIAAAIERYGATKKQSESDLPPGMVGREETGVDITKESEDLYNNLNQSYNDKNDGVGLISGNYHQVRRQTYIHNNSQSKHGGNNHACANSISANSRGSSIENVPPIAFNKQRQLKLLQPFNTSPAYQKEDIQPRGISNNRTNSIPASTSRERLDNQRSHIENTIAHNEILAQTAPSSLANANQTSSSLWQPHRRVSILLKVNSHPRVDGGESNCDDGMDEDGYGPILFPISIGQEDDVNDATSEAGRCQSCGEVILVNPHAFDAKEGVTSQNQETAGRITVETARLVAEVSQISSEDWARKYKFDDVVWPSNCKRFPPPTAPYHDALSSLVSAIVENVILSSRRMNNTPEDRSPWSTVICAMGGSASGKTNTVFGLHVGGLVSSATRNVNSRVVAGPDANDLGLIGGIISGILTGCSSVRCSISILEIAGDDVIRDIIGFSDEGLGENGGTKALRVRHFDNRGAVVTNLSQLDVENMEQLRRDVQSAFRSNSLLKMWSEDGGHGHLLTTISISKPGGDECASVQLVDLASPDRAVTSDRVSKRVAFVRKSLSSLRGVLQGILSESSAPVLFRESTLTKLLQRNLDEQGERKSSATIIGTVRPDSKSYNQTLSTVDFMTRLLSKPGDTALSPFSVPTSANRAGQVRAKESIGGLAEKVSRKSSIVSSHSPALQESIINDPRQRLAKLMHTAGSNGVVNSTPTVNTSKDRSISSNEGASQGTLDNYNNVFGELDILMNAEDDSVDRNSYGEDIIQALTPYKVGHSKDGSSVDSQELLTPSPLLAHLDKYKKQGVDSKQEKGKLRHDEGKQNMGCTDPRRSLFVGRTPGPGQHSAVGSYAEPVDKRKPISPAIHTNKTIKASLVSTELHGDSTQQCHTDLEFSASPKPFELQPTEAEESQRKMKEITQAVNPRTEMSDHEHAYERKDSGPPVTIFYENHIGNTNDIAYGKHSTRGVIEGSTHPPSDQNEGVSLLSNSSPTNERSKCSGSVFVQKQSLAPLKRLATEDSFESELLVSSKDDGQFFDDASPNIESSPTFNILDSFRQEVDDLVTSLTSPSELKTGHEGIVKDPNVNFLADEISSLKAKVESLNEEKAVSDAFLRRIQEVVKAGGDPEVSADQPSSWSHSQKAIANAVRDRELLIGSLQSQLELAEAEIVELKRELSHLGIDLKEARREIDSKAKASESEITRLMAQMQDLNGKLKESVKRENKLKSTVRWLEKRSQEAMALLQTKKEETEKVAEEAILGNEALSQEVAALRGKLLSAQNDHDALKSSYNSVVKDHRNLLSQCDELNLSIDQKDGEIARMKSSCAACREEKGKLEYQLTSIRTKTVDVMKERIQALKDEYSRRLEEYRSNYPLERDGEELSRLRLELSRKESESDNLKKRVERMEQSAARNRKDAEERLIQVQGELFSAKSDALKQREVKESMQTELENLRSLMDIAEESVAEVKLLKEENRKLGEAVRVQQTGIETPFEIGDNRSSANEGDQMMHERMSLLMRENEHNNISMRSLQSENVSLKNSIKECTNTMQLMQSEMSELKDIASDGISNLRKKEKALLQEQRKDKDAIMEMEKKLENANALLRSLRTSPDRGSDAQLFSPPFN